MPSFIIEIRWKGIRWLTAAWVAGQQVLIITDIPIRRSALFQITNHIISLFLFSLFIAKPIKKNK